MKLFINLYFFALASQVSGQAETCGDVFCADGVTNPDFPIMEDLTCSKFKDDVASLSADSQECLEAKVYEFACCPGYETCNTVWCPDGVENDVEIDEGFTCSMYPSFLGLIPVDDEACESAKIGQGLCCPSQADGETCAASFCPDYINGDLVIVEGDDMTCNDYANFLAFLPGDSEDCAQALSASYICCPPVEPECFLCGGKDVQMNNPDGYYGGGVTCEQLDKMRFQLVPAQSCESVREVLNEFISLESFCGCEGYEAPEICGPVCDANQSINKDGFIVLEDDDDFNDEGRNPPTNDYDYVDDDGDDEYYDEPITCEQGNEYAKHITDNDFCMDTVDTAANKEACCIGTGESSTSKAKASKSAKSFSKSAKSGKSYSKSQKEEKSSKGYYGGYYSTKSEKSAGGYYSAKSAKSEKSEGGYYSA